MELVPHIVVLGLATAVIVASTRLMSVRSHAPFFFVLAQAYVYCFLAPFLNLYYQQNCNPILVNWYFHLELVCLLLFVPTLFISYNLLAGCLLSQQRHSITQVVINIEKIPFLSIFSLLSSVFYLAALTYSGLLYRRIGHSGLANEYVNLWAPLFYGIRVYDRLSIGLVLLNYLAYRRSQPGPQRVKCIGGLASTLIVQVVVSALNSRMQMITTFVLLGVVHGLCVDPAGSRRRLFFSVGKVLTACFVLYGINFTVNIRYFWKGSLAETIEPYLFITSAIGLYAEQFLGEASQRLDGIDLIARMGPELEKRGFNFGESWAPAIMATIGPLLGYDSARRMKLDTATTPKYYLMYEYAGIEMPDYSSCILTDAYGNFGILGIALAAIALAIGCAIVSRSLVAPTSRLNLVAGIIGVVVVTQFEAAMISLLLLSWIQFAPAILILYCVAPFRPVVAQRERPRNFGCGSWRDSATRLL